MATHILSLDTKFVFGAHHRSAANQATIGGRFCSDARLTDSHDQLKLVHCPNQFCSEADLHF
jgi:hypothetical protein